MDTMQPSQPSTRRLRQLLTEKLSWRESSSRHQLNGCKDSNKSTTGGRIQTTSDMKGKLWSDHSHTVDPGHQEEENKLELDTYPVKLQLLCKTKRTSN